MTFFKYTFALLILLAGYNSIAQIDSNYIKPVEQKFAIRPTIGYDLLAIEQDIGKKEISYSPNNPPLIGLGIFVKNTLIDFSYAHGFKFLSSSERGKTSSFDLQFHNYGRKFVFDIYVQKYKGFYTEDENNKNIELFPDIKYTNLGLNTQYVFNNKQFSYKAIYNYNETQLISAGSFLVGAGIYMAKIDSDSSFVHLGENSLESFQFGVNGGYAHSWVLRKGWCLSASGTVGVNLGSKTVREFGSSRLQVHPTVLPRLAAIYNKNSWAITFAMVANFISLHDQEENGVTAFSANIQFSFIKRFDHLFGKKKN